MLRIHYTKGASYKGLWPVVLGMLSIVESLVYTLSVGRLVPLWEWDFMRWMDAKGYGKDVPLCCSDETPDDNDDDEDEE